MFDTLFNTSLLATSLEPWENQVFRKKFDAYFFVTYPPFQYNPTEAYNPFPFMNNLQEDNIFISNLNQSLLLQHTLDKRTWNAAPFYDEFKAKFQAERFLFWRSENEKWALFSDEKLKIAVIGVDWNLANQVPLFHQQCLLSLKNALDYLNLQQKEADFLKNYAPSSILTEGDEANPVWVKYYFQCHVPTEDDRLYYWKNFEPLHEAVMKVLPNFKSVDMYADQAFWRRYKQRGTIYASGKNAPVGGWQKYSYDNCKKVATKFLTQNQHLQLSFEENTAASEALYLANKNGLIEFMNFLIYANVEKVKVKGHLSDFHFALHRPIGTKNSAYNQSFELFYKKNLLDATLIDKLVSILTKIGFAKTIYRLEQPQTFAKFSIEKPLEIDGIYGTVPNFEEDNRLIIND